REAAGDLEGTLAQLGRLAPEELSAADRLRAAGLEARLLHGLGHFADARGAGRRWAALAEASGDRRALAAAHQLTASAYFLQGSGREGGSFQRQALAAIEDADPPDPELEAKILTDLVTMLATLGEYAEAEVLVTRARRLEGEGGDPRRAYRLASAWGTMLHQAGDVLGALEERERALAAAELAADPLLLATALVNLAQTEIGVHDYTSALARLQRSLGLETRTHNRIIAVITTGICHLELNQLARAEQAFDQARRSASDAGNDRLEGWALGELGLVASERGNAEDALALFDRAIAISRRGGDRRNEMVWWTNKGRVRRDQGRWQEALAFYREAERLEESIAGQRPGANLRKQMGQCHAGLGGLDHAEEMFLQARDLSEAAGDSKVLWETQRELARLYQQTGRHQAARLAWERALDAIETIRGALRIESLEAGFFTDKVEVYAEAIGFLLAEGGAEGAARAFEIAERARARAFLGSLAESRAALHETVPAELVAEEHRLLREISRLQLGERRGDEDPDPARRLEEAEAGLAALDLRIRAERPRFAELRSLAPAGLAAVQRTLVRGEVLLEYFLAEPVSHLWVVERDAVTHHALPAAAILEKQVRRAYTELLDPASTPQLDELGRVLLSPLARLDPAPQALLIVPSGILHYLPFEVLSVSGAPLVELVATSYLPSASVLVELRSRPVEPGGPRLLAVGDAPYHEQAEPERTTLAGVRSLRGLRSLGALPHTRREVERLSTRFGRRASTVLLGRDAREGNLKAEDLERFSMLHLAIHGWIDATSAARSGLVLGAGPGDDDGVLQFREILRLRLAADLVTLSACQSALGELVTGEGMVSLARAFFYAGSDSVVATLWSVADEASADLMAELYEGLADGLPKAEALRRARLAVRADPRFAHPYYWAPFVLLGRGEDGVEVPRGGRPSAIVATLAATLSLGAGLGLLRRRRRA
ncbi:MAG TPA: CHAT domain-containing tetratricopeptide repeat protein, partial [Planctomycetota bacterium]|nr:CHAT domain-containing tetratricopeptide repeat protein [Planctomycetota bacterium]